MHDADLFAWSALGRYWPLSKWAMWSAWLGVRRGASATRRRIRSAWVSVVVVVSMQVLCREPATGWEL